MLAGRGRACRAGGHDRHQPAARGRERLSIGAPQGLELTLAEGILSSRRGDGEYQLLQTTAAISPGSSGGGLFDDAGRLIGMTAMLLEKGQQMNFSVPVEWIAELPARHEANRQTAKSMTSKHDDYDPATEAAIEAVEAQAAADAAKHATPDEAAAAADAAASQGRTRWNEAWFSISGAPSRLDTETIEISGMRVRVWTIDDYPKSTTLTGTPRLSQTLAQSEFDCANRTMRVTEMTYYDAAGSELTSLDEPSGFVKPPRDSVGEARLNDICQYRSQLSGD